MESRPVVAWGHGGRKGCTAEGHRMLLLIWLWSRLHAVHFPPTFLIFENVLSFCISCLHYSYIRKLLECLPFLHSFWVIFVIHHKWLFHSYWDSSILWMDCTYPSTLDVPILPPFTQKFNKMMPLRKTALCAWEESPSEIIALIFSLTFLVIYLKFHDFQRNRLFSLRNASSLSPWEIWKTRTLSLI